ncbi:MAG: glycosyltransferase family 25 protein [Steroidobacteraceae bacterium]
MLKTFLDRIYVINLPERTDRRRQIERELQMIGFPPGDPRVEFPHAPRPTDTNGFPSRAVYGNYLSHLAIVEDAAAKGYRRIMILEDDALFSSRLINGQTQLVDELGRRPWDLCFLGHSLTTEIADQPDGLVDTACGFIWMHCFIVNASVHARLIEYLKLSMTLTPGDPLGARMYIDAAYAHFRKQNPEVITLVAKPAVSRQRGSPSSIAGRHWFDHIAFLQPAVRPLRWVRDEYWRRTN